MQVKNSTEQLSHQPDPHQTDSVCMDLLPGETLVYKTELESELIAKIEPVLGSLGYDLRDVEIAGSPTSHATVRIFLESRPGQNPIGIEDCVKAHETLSPLFDVWDPIEGSYTLEMSSPGEKPCLRTSRHFADAVGQRIRFETNTALPMPAPAKARKRWDGTLKEFLPQERLLILSDHWGEHRVPLSELKQAEVILEWKDNEDVKKKPTKAPKAVSKKTEEK